MAKNRKTNAEVKETKVDGLNENAVAEQQKNEVAEIQEQPLGFENEEEGDLIIPRVKVIQTLSPERKDKSAEEGDIINSLTKERLNGKTFIPVFKFNNNIDWRDRADGGGIKCIARDGKMGECSDGSFLACAQCRRCEFDNSKTGREAAPKCTKYINFLGFFAGEPVPIILSFSKTNFKEGKQLYSLAKVTMQNMWNHGYALNEKVMAKGGNEWFIISITPTGATSDTDRAFGMQLYKQFSSTIQTMKIDIEDTAVADEGKPAGSEDVNKTEY